MRAPDVLLGAGLATGAMGAALLGLATVGARTYIPPEPMVCVLTAPAGEADVLLPAALRPAGALVGVCQVGGAP